MEAPAIAEPIRPAPISVPSPPSSPPTSKEPSPATPIPFKPKRGRPPLDPQAREAKAKREVLRRKMEKLKEAKTEEELFAKLEELRPRPAPPPHQEVYSAKQKTPAEETTERIAAAQKLHEAAAAQVAQIVGMVKAAVEGSRFELSDQKANLLVFTTTPWAASQPNVELSPRMKGVLAGVGLAAWLLPPVAGLVKEYGPKVAGWMRERRERAEREAAHP